ncbi:alpha/beta fold hydrolase [Psychrobacillus sp. OK032]|uniref:alpha/beta fold hydrolase n=1 Tax=Psychrobacillus sp. OK032 TaxID=1884358 RepID=UPI0008B954E0|nr:alpha/beta hydrolase [Psychrobacillus sp. OK032]SES30955.1 Pimeloyl-ACP methyl ester carboxylesterase [Psychrobacillus sp. OK032]
MEITTVLRNILGVIAFPLTTWNITMNQLNKAAPPGEIVQTKYSEVHTILSGVGEVTVILEAGLGSVSIDWCYVQPEVSKFVRVLSYDRGNYGWSRTRRKTLTSIDSVEEIKEVLVKLNLQPPYILVGHSFGGLSMRLFASMYPDEVAGLVLVDSVHENQYLVGNQNKKFKRLVTFGYVTSLMGLPRIVKQKVGRKILAKEYDKHLKYIGFTLGAYKSIYREYIDSTISANQLLDAKPLRGDLPVIVVSAEPPSEQWKEQQLLLSTLTNKTEHIQTKAGHSIHLEDPKILIDCIKKLVVERDG